MSAQPAQAADLSHVETWVFDLDNTLYPADGRLFDQVDERMGSFIADYLKVDRVEARKIQKLYYHEYGTTLSGLMSVYGMEPKAFLDYVHDIDVTVIDPNPKLKQAIARLPGRRVIYTNGSLAHARNVLEHLGMADQFESIFDIVASDYVPKPHRKAFERILSLGCIEPRGAVMFEDIARNLEAAHALGMTTVWVRPKVSDWPGQGDSASREELASDPHINHITDDLAEFLGAAVVA